MGYTAVLFLTVILGCVLKQSEACTCIPRALQDIYCESDFGKSISQVFIEISDSPLYVRNSPWGHPLKLRKYIYKTFVAFTKHIYQGLFYLNRALLLKFCL